MGFVGLTFVLQFQNDKITKSRIFVRGGGVVVDPTFVSEFKSPKSHISGGLGGGVVRSQVLFQSNGFHPNLTGFGLYRGRE